MHQVERVVRPGDLATFAKSGHDRDGQGCRVEGWAGPWLLSVSWAKDSAVSNVCQDRLTLVDAKPKGVCHFLDLILYVFRQIQLDLIG